MNGGHIAIVTGTRPEIIKLAHLCRALGADGKVVHTNQHQDNDLAGIFLSAADLRPARTLAGIKGLPRYAQVARMLKQLGDAFAADHPAAVVVQGDTNTALAAAQAANYAGAPVIHVEAGLRSFDRAMPEEINRCMISVLADVHCAPTPLAVEQLVAAGVPRNRIEFTGNTIVETTLAMIPDQLAKLGLPVLLPLHPRTRLAAERYGLAAALDRLIVRPPAGHRSFLAFCSLARLIVSDSGGIQEECTVLKRPLLVIRNSTERPESVATGFAWLVRPGPMIGELGRALIADAGIEERLAARPCPYGDGTASDKVAAIARRYLGSVFRGNR